MLKRLEINGFKAIREAKIEFGRVNLFIGPNGHGKSTVLEALGLLSAALERTTDDALQRRGVRLSVPTLFKSSFKNHKFLTNITLDATFDQGVNYTVSVRAGAAHDTLVYFTESISSRGKRQMGRSPNGVTVSGLKTDKSELDNTRGVWNAFVAAADLAPELRSELGVFEKYAIYSPQTGFLRGVEGERLQVRPIGLQGDGLPTAVARVVARWRDARSIRKTDPSLWSLIDELLGLVWAPGWAQQFFVGDFDPAHVSRQVRAGNQTLYLIDKFMDTKRNRLSAYDSSEGTLFLAFIVVLLLHPDAPKVFSLDNVDNALNPGTTKLLLGKIIEATCDDRFRERNVGPEQVFLTSHNPTALDAFDLFDDDQRIFVVSREPAHGMVTINRLRPNEGWTKADWIEAKKGRTLSELWIEGELPGALGL